MQVPLGISFSGGGNRSSEGSWSSQSHSGSLRGSWGWSSVTWHFPVQVALTLAVPVRPELHWRVAGPLWVLRGEWGISNGGGDKLVCSACTTVCPCFSPQDGERRYREASARKKIRLDRQVGAGRWEGTQGSGLSTGSPGLRASHFCSATLVLGVGWALCIHAASFHSGLTSSLYRQGHGRQRD